MIFAVAAALGASTSTSGDPIVANWDNITISGSGSGENTAKTMTFSGGGTRQLRINYEALGTILYKKNSAAYVTVADGELVSVVTTDTVGFKFVGSDASEVLVVTVTDYTLSSTIDTFTVDFTYSGGGGLPP